MPMRRRCCRSRRRAQDAKGNEIKYNLEDPVNQAVFPGLQGGPHNHTITALAVALKQAALPEFKQYQTQVPGGRPAPPRSARSRVDGVLTRGYTFACPGVHEAMSRGIYRDCPETQESLHRGQAPPAFATPCACVCSWRARRRCFCFFRSAPALVPSLSPLPSLPPLETPRCSPPFHPLIDSVTTATDPDRGFSAAAAARQVLANSKAMANKLTSLGYKLVSGGTDNHLVRRTAVPVRERVQRMQG
jgi:hypothetical protein